VPLGAVGATWGHDDLCCGGRDCKSLPQARLVSTFRREALAGPLASIRAQRRWSGFDRIYRWPAARRRDRDGRRVL